MKSLSLYSALLALTGGSALAQLATLPPFSSADGTPIQSIGINAGASHWENADTLGRYRLAGDTTLPLPSGLTWASSAPAQLSTRLATIANDGGTIQMIFAAETAGWLNDFGYTYSGRPTGPDSFTVFSNIQAVEPATVRFGDHIDVTFLPDDPFSRDFDFWYNATDSFDLNNPAPPTMNGGVYTVFNQANSTPYNAPGNVKFAQSPLMVNTWVSTVGAYVDTPTYLVSIEDWRSDRGSDQDTTDFIFALQFFPLSGRPFDTPVPEPSAYGLVGAAALIGLMAWRSRKARSTE